MITVLSIILILVPLIIAINRTLMGIHRGVFYAMGNQQNFHTAIDFFIENIHRAATPTYYGLIGTPFLLLTILFYQFQLPELFFLNWINITNQWVLSISHAFILSMSGSFIGSTTYQGFINIGSGLPFIDPDEKMWSEFNLFGLISFWWPRLGSYFRLLFSIFGLLLMIIEANYIINNIN